jgi:superfamily II DNA or RNA helicase
MKRFFSRPTNNTKPVPRTKTHPSSSKSSVPIAVAEPKPENYINIPTYLGKKGYTISKSDLSEQDLTFIREKLTITPFTGGGPVQQTVKFPAYRESSKKIYMPRYFGIQHFGQPKTIEISEGQDINIQFQGSLRDYQQNVVNIFANACQTNSGGLVSLPCGRGKTVIGLNIIATLKKKALIIVHKEFLLNQWVERIEQYLPTARVGRIQGPIIDIEGKDIVIGMLQSLSMKDYEDGTFDSFGLLLIDEVHHISSEVFSNSLFRIVTKYTLGLSATMDRKDGTTFVFKMFLGDIVYKETASTEKHNVQVRAIDYRSDDTDFNQVLTDFRGNVSHSSMIVKLCDYIPRSEFILRALSDLLVEFPDMQVMIIAHNRSLLTYLHDAIRDRGICGNTTRYKGNVGYYLGGMKETALKQTEEKQVVIATYAMAAEALDIKTLSGLIMATPKTDIEQTVGRILRSKHEQPVVIDIVDAHDPYQKQWIKRRAFFKKQDYEIRMTASTNYVTDVSKWKMVYKAKNCEQTDNNDDDDNETPSTFHFCATDLQGFVNDDNENNE